MNAPPKPPPSSVETELSLVVAKVAKFAIPDVQGITVVLVTPRGVTVQRAGSMSPRELGRCLRQFADELERESARQARIIMPGGS